MKQQIFHVNGAVISANRRLTLQMSLQTKLQMRLQMSWQVSLHVKRVVAALVAVCGLAQAQTPTPPDAWALAGQQGLVRHVIVPLEQARDEAAYIRQLAWLCEPERSCFVNFYTNSRGQALEWPLPDAVTQEATATFRRSMKNGAERLMWSCRLTMERGACF